MLLRAGASIMVKSGELGWVLGHRMGVDGMVWAIIVASLASSILLAGRFVRVARRLPGATLVKNTV